MKKTEGIGLKDVQGVYSGPEGMLWELIMGEQIHIGGLKSSMDLAEKASIGAGMSGIDLCCCTGAGMRFLVKFRNVTKMSGVDATQTVVDRGIRRSEEQGVSDKMQFVVADACNSGLSDATADFVWGEDAWCYVVDKVTLISEAARLVKPGGTIAFTDWVEGDTPMTDAEADGLLRFMKFPNILSIDGYTALLGRNHCQILKAEDTGRFASYMDLYLNMLDMQLTYDALRIIGFDTDMMGSLAAQMMFIQKLAHEGKIAQGLFVARKAA